MEDKKPFFMKWSIKLHQQAITQVRRDIKDVAAELAVLIMTSDEPIINLDDANLVLSKFTKLK